MAKLYISEYDNAARDNVGVVQAGQEPDVATQTVNIGGASAQSNAFGANTRFVRIHTDAICSIKFGADPTATTSTARLAANQTEFFGVKPGHKVAVITNT